MKTEEEMLSAIREDEWMLDVLRAAKTLNLPDWWVCAGFVRSKVWDALHNYAERTPLGDIDVIYYDESNLDEELEKDYERELGRLMPELLWSVKNQARMHEVNDLPPYLSSVDAISRFPETATALGMKLDASGQLELTAPHGLVDLLELKVRPTPAFERDERLMKTYRQRLVSKQWTRKWPKVTVDSAQDRL
ncbi:MAG TPA: nucleotidyltransferase family protein [Planococcus sp. (in: firmicutes)]|nr:nucleotidyltransferase family protein [Planococcus sp. (in: firmicutes)]